MSQNLPAAHKPQIVAGGQVAALIPQSLDEAFRVSTAIAASGLAPRGIDKPEQILVAIMAGAELGLAPFQSLQSFAVVNGRPTLWGDGLMAVVRSQGVRVREWIDGEGEAMVAHCEATRPDSGEIIERAFSVGDAKKAGLWGKQGPWQQHPKRMLQMRARSFCLRDGCADMLRGIQVREEVQDYEPIRNVTPQPAGLAARLAAGRATAAEGFTASTGGAREESGHDPETGEVEEAEEAHFTDRADEIAAEGAGEFVDAAEGGDDTFPGDRPAPQEQTSDLTLAQRAAAYEKRIDEAPSTVKLKAIRAAGEKLRADLDQGDPELLVDLEAKWTERFNELEARERAGE